MLPLIAAALPLIADLVPEVIGWFGGDKAEDAAKDVISIAKKVTGIEDDKEAIEAISKDPEQARLFRESVLKGKLAKDKMYLEDRQNARNMQTVALNQKDTFSKRFVYYFAIAWSIFCFVYIAAITFATIPAANVRFADTILGFLLGTVVAGIIQFFYGSSQSSKDKDEASQSLTAELTKRL